MTGKQTTGKERQTGKSRRKGAWAIGHIAAQVTGGVFERHGLGRGEIAHAWVHIVGPELAPFCRPEHITPAAKGARGGKGTGQRRGGTLHVVASGAHGVDVHYAAGRIVAGVNALYGHEVVARINVKTAGAVGDGPGAPEAAFRSTGVAPRPPAQPRDLERFAEIGPEGLRHALARLEAGILAEDT